MKNMITIVLLFLATYSFAQDTSLILVYDNTQTNTTKEDVAFYVDGVLLLNSNTLSAIDPDNIDEVKVEKEPFKIGNKEYRGKIKITTKKGYEPVLISLTNFTKKYTKLERKDKMYQIDGHIVSGNYDTYIIDEKCIQKVIVEKLTTSKNHDIHVVKLITKSNNAVNASQEIRLKGTNYSRSLIRG